MEQPIMEISEIRVMECALLAAQAMLENGAETYRAEETAARICDYFSLNDVQVYAMPTGIFLSLPRPDKEPLNIMRRLRKRSVNLGNIQQANQLSRNLSSGKLSIEEASAELNGLLASGKKGKRLFSIIATALSAGFFTLLFGGGLIEFFISTFSGGIVQFISSSFGREDSFHIIISLIGGLICALSAAVVAVFLPHINMDATIIGSIMPLLPGLAMTNAIRDTMRGDLVSGVARGAEALLIAVAVASGVGVILGLRIVLAGLGGIA